MHRNTTFRFAVIMVALVMQGPARSYSPSFQLVIAKQGVKELAVGTKLQLRVYQAFVMRGSKPPKPITTALRWSVEPKDAATIDAQGGS